MNNSDIKTIASLITDLAESQQKIISVLDEIIAPGTQPRLVLMNLAADLKRIRDEAAALRDWK